MANTLVGKAILILCGIPLGFAMSLSLSFADSLWEHNGSVMRLITDGHERKFLFERPSPILKQAGVEQGTILFDGYQVGDKYIGKARSFSKDCPVPVVYDVSGNEFRETKVVLQGRRADYDKTCRATGRFIHEHLSFNYLESVQETQSELLSEEQARAKAITLLKGEPYGSTPDEVTKRILEAQLITAGTVCGKTVRSPLWQLHVAVPKNAIPTGNNAIDGNLVIDARSGMMLCSDLPFLF